MVGAERQADIPCQYLNPHIIAHRNARLAGKPQLAAVKFRQAQMPLGILSGNAGRQYNGSAFFQTEGLIGARQGLL